MNTQNFIRLLDEELTVNSLQFNSALAENNLLFARLRGMINMNEFLDNLTYHLSRVKIAVSFGKLEEMPQSFTDDFFSLLQQLRIYSKSLFSIPEFSLQYLPGYMSTGNELIKLAERYLRNMQLDDYVIEKFRKKEKLKFSSGSPHAKPGYFSMN